MTHGGGKRRRAERRETGGSARKALRTATVGAVSATLVAGSVLGLAPAAQAAGGVRFVDITGDGGTVLKANVVTPADADGTRRYPLVVLPTSWACRRSSTWPRPGSSPTPAMSWSPTTCVVSGSPADE